jgi:uncharacterized protein (DUF1778 family)
VTRTQLNIKIDPELLQRVKFHAVRQGKTLTEFVIEVLQQAASEEPSSLEARLRRIEQHLGID